MADHANNRPRRQLLPQPGTRPELCLAELQRGLELLPYFEGVDEIPSEDRKCSTVRSASGLHPAPVTGASASGLGRNSGHVTATGLTEAQPVAISTSTLAPPYLHVSLLCTRHLLFQLSITPAFGLGHEFDLLEFSAQRLDAQLS